MRHNRILIIIGTHRRHLYLANKIAKAFPLAGLIVQEREDILPMIPKLGKIDTQNFKKHFLDRNKAEEKYFRFQQYPDCVNLLVTKDTLNSRDTINFVKVVKPDIVVTFGCGILKELLKVLPKRTINLHLGLSPRYKGTATLFWPFYFLEPNHAGSTIHYINKGTDDGDVIHQVVPSLKKTDKIHDVACKVVIKSVEEIIKLLKLKKWRSIKQQGNGKLFLNSDFRPEHLRVVYNNDIIKEYLEGKITSKAPKLFNQYEKIS